MRQKELRLALVCYGGISLAVYMHGITKEIWRLARASRNFHAGAEPLDETEAIYRELIQQICDERELKIRVLPDIIAGASAGGINGVYLAQAIASGQSLDPLTTLWLECADIDVLLDPDARPFSWFTKIWAQPLVWLALSRPGGTVERTVSKEARSEVKTKLSHLIRARWFAPPFSGTGFTRLLYNATEAMAEAECGPKLIPYGQPLDLFVTVTDFYGHLERLRLNSPPEVVETEHRLTIGFHHVRGRDKELGDPAELSFAARATASFPGAFPPFHISEVDAVLADKGKHWPSRDRFLRRTFPRRYPLGEAEDAVLIDGAVLANAPFAQAIQALKNRPAHRQIDRRFVYIDPKPDLGKDAQAKERKNKEGVRLPGFIATIFGAISDIPREQPIRDNLEDIEARTNKVIRMRQIVENMRGEVEQTVQDLFGRTLFLDSPNSARISAWRNRAQYRAAQMAGFTYPAYGQLKLTNIVEEIVATLQRAHGSASMAYLQNVRTAIWAELRNRGLNDLSDRKGGATPQAINFFRAHDLGFRVRRLRLLARRLGEEIASSGNAPPEAVVAMHDTIYDCLAQYLEREELAFLGGGFEDFARNAVEEPGAALDALDRRRHLRDADNVVDERLTIALCGLPKAERRSLLLAYLGFPFYDIATLALLQDEGLNEYDPIKVDRISPDDAVSIRGGGAAATLKGIEFNSFGAFFSRAYRENDYLWGRLHGAERMIDLIASTLDADERFSPAMIATYKQRIFNAILDSEEKRLITDKELIPGIRREVEAMETDIGSGRLAWPKAEEG